MHSSVFQWLNAGCRERVVLSWCAVARDVQFVKYLCISYVFGFWFSLYVLRLLGLCMVCGIN